MAPNSSSTTLVAPSFLEQDYEYDTDNDVFLFYPSRPASDPPRDDALPPYPIGFYNLPVFRNNKEDLPFFLHPAESVHSDSTAVTFEDDDSYGREGDTLRLMGYSHCFCLGLISIGAPNWPHPATAQDFTATPWEDRASFTLRSFFTRLWNKFLRR